jgi:hypothetical protein
MTVTSSIITSVPLGRIFFPSFVGENGDAKFYAFSIRYTPSEDVELKEHSDASIVSLNLNLNLPVEDFAGSSIYFVSSKEKYTTAFFKGIQLSEDEVDEEGKQQQQQQETKKNAMSARTSEDGRPILQQREIRFDPGMALLHRGMTRHAALPIEDGSRHNLAIWLYGHDGCVRIAPYDEHEQLTIEQRWARRPRDKEKKNSREKEISHA